VLSIRPAPLTGFPTTSKMTLLSTGGFKLIRLAQLKHSMRNCKIEASERVLMGMFLNNEKSRETSPGPMSEFRPASPYCVLGLGGVKQATSMYWLALPGFTPVAQPGPEIRSGCC